MSWKVKALQCLQTSAWWAKYSTHTFLYSYQTSSQSRSQSVPVDPGVLLTTSLTASSPDLTRLKALSTSNKNTTAQNHSIMTIVVEKDSVIKLQYKKIETPADISPHWGKLQQCLDQFASLSVCHFILSAVQQQVYVWLHETSQCSLPARVSVAACWLIPFDSEASRHSTSLRGPSPWLHKSGMTASGGPSATCLKRSMCGLLGHPLRHTDYEITLLHTCNHVILITGTSTDNVKFYLQ